MVSDLAYERDPAAIYRQSFATIRAEAALDNLPLPLQPVAIRMMHACGMTDLVADLRYSAEVVEATATALRAKAPILCDAQMVRHGIITGLLPASNEVRCTLHNDQTRAHAQKIANTRSAAAIEAWRDELGGAVVVIGNAPTALFHLLELLDEGWPRPAAIIGLPVGFVGAAESKAALADDPRGVPYLTLLGRRGGSAMSAAAINALAAGLAEAP